MFRILFTILLLTLISLTAKAQTTFERVYSDSGITSAYDIVTTYDGGYAVTGFKTCSSFNCQDFFLLKLDSLGNKEWVRLYEAGYNGNDYGYSIMQLNDSGYVLVGVAATAPNLANNVRLLKTDKNGNKLWDRNYGGLGCQEGYDVEQTYDGGFIIATQQDTGGNCFEIQVELIKTDTAGIIEWQKTYFNAGNGRAVAVKQSSDSGYVVTGVTNDMLTPSSGEDIFLLKTDKNGGTLWTKFYGGAGTERGEDVIVSSDNGFVIAGYTNGVSSLVGAYVIKTNNVGDTLWTRVYEKNDQTYGTSIIEDSSNDYLITGVSSVSTPVANSDMYLLKINNTGNVIFEHQFQYQANAQDNANSIVLTKDGGYIMCGLTSSPGLSQVYIVKTDSNGLVTSVNNLQAPKINVTIYPNPFNNYATINLYELIKNNNTISISLIDLTGKVVFKTTTTEHFFKLHNQNYPKGMYLLKLNNNQHTIITKKLIIN